MAKAIFIAVVLILAACGDETVHAGSLGSGESIGVPASPTTLPESPGRLEGPPDLRITAGDTQMSIAPYSYCWSLNGQNGQGVCADGAPREPLPTVTLDETSQLGLWFPLDWQLWATLFAGGQFCDGAVVIEVDPQGSSLESLGPADTYRVEVSGRGQEGDAAWAFELVTRNNRPSPPPFVAASWFPSGRDLEADAPFSAEVGNILAKPTEVSATVAVAASNGESTEFVLSIGDDGGCWGSSIDVLAPAQFTAQVLASGPPPFKAILTVTVDGRTIVGEPIRWPADYPANSNESRRVAANVMPG